MNLRQLILAIYFIFDSIFLCGQDKKINTSTQNWSEIDFVGKITPKLKWQLDIQYARQSPYENLYFWKYNAQLTARGWLHYYPKKTIKISTFAGRWYNYFIGDNVQQREYPEYRTALQAQFFNIWGRNTLSNRFRPEFRKIRNREDHFENVIRGRYMIKYQRLLTHDDYVKNSLYFIASNEFFINGGSKITGYKLFDQNRVFIGLGYCITPNIIIETGYYNQFVHHARDTNFDLNHIWQITLILDNITKIDEMD